MRFPDWALIPSNHRVGVFDRCANCDRPFLTILNDGDAAPKSCTACRKASERVDRLARGEKVALHKVD